VPTPIAAAKNMVMPGEISQLSMRLGAPPPALTHFASKDHAAWAVRVAQIATTLPMPIRAMCRSSTSLAAARLLPLTPANKILFARILRSIKRFLRNLRKFRDFAQIPP
tara:strand:+ start:990 stop:1316 length:327 start_codon:yes stop_codon:yes gene_type:complete